ncbi:MULTISPECIES: TetR/AcrR family transcriptional regulator [Pseudomonas fluorescens group]|uniref:TetR/AcrR family transcriptional regulator n=1 Tax=Pseudomonas fluorescens group TaxID=136843 RepID=UPI00139856F8|nr:MULTISPECIES: TetR/AcrR family transcriptional regulator [Pseudomonas fluorescens group]MBP3997967.1 TetR/AcrR family transcriptional regulator [Pseudomonas koreensis]QIA04137.1 TetR/AcrR family transcriptional regulator [Pseudomonas fluorescens]
MSTTEIPEHTQPRRRLSREDRQRQLLDMAWQLIREEGTDALTLGYLAEKAGVTKPVVYDHFTTRAGLLAALYQDFDRRQTALMDAALANAEATLNGIATVIATAYVDCVLTQGNEIPGVIAALASTPELEKIKREYEAIFLEKCRNVLSPFADGAEIGQAGLRAMLGAAEALSQAAATNEISAEQARDELLATIIAMVERAATRATQAGD